MRTGFTAIGFQICEYRQRGEQHIHCRNGCKLWSFVAKLLIIANFQPQPRFDPMTVRPHCPTPTWKQLRPNKHNLAYSPGQRNYLPQPGIITSALLNLQDRKICFPGLSQFKFIKNACKENRIQRRLVGWLAWLFPPPLSDPFKAVEECGNWRWMRGVEG